MAARKTHFATALLPSRSWVQRMSRLFLVMAALLLLALSKTESPVAGNIRTAILDTVSPVVEVIASPLDAASDAAAWFSGMVEMRAENVRLKNQNIQLLQWQATAKRMEAENASLKKLMRVVPAQKYTYITVHMVSDFSGPFAQSALVNGGKDQGVKRDQAVINEDGLLGRVVETGDTTARVLLLTDINSRVPVITERSRQKSMMTGNNTPLPTLSYLSASNGIDAGERILTSGDGGIFPAGIPVGVVEKVTGASATVRLFTDISRVEYVSVIDYAF